MKQITFTKKAYKVGRSRVIVVPRALYQYGLIDIEKPITFTVVNEKVDKNVDEEDRKTTDEFTVPVPEMQEQDNRDEMV